MSRAEWELIEMARARALADRYEREALESAAAHGCVGVQAQQAWALGWLAMRCADRQVRLEAESPTRIDTHSASWRDGYDTGFAEGDSGVFNSDGSYKDAPPTPRLIGQKAEQQHGKAVPKDAARAHAAGPATPPPPRPQGVAGTPQCGECGDDPATCGCWEPDSQGVAGSPPARESRK